MNQLLESPQLEASTYWWMPARQTVATKRILVAEDDEAIRRLMSAALFGAGFVVKAVVDGEQAWEALHHEHFDLLLTDNEMPRLTGKALIGQIRKENISLPVIMASGNFSLESAHTDPELRIAAVIPKPFDIVELLDTVRHVLQTSGGTAAADQEDSRQLCASPQPVR